MKTLITVIAILYFLGCKQSKNTEATNGKIITHYELIEQYDSVIGTGTLPSPENVFIGASAGIGFIPSDKVEYFDSLKALLPHVRNLQFVYFGDTTAYDDE